MASDLAASLAAELSSYGDAVEALDSCVVKNGAAAIECSAMQAAVTAFEAEIDRLRAEQEGLRAQEELEQQVRALAAAEAKLRACVAGAGADAGECQTLSEEVAAAAAAVDAAAAAVNTLEAGSGGGDEAAESPAEAAGAPVSTSNGRGSAGVIVGVVLALLAVAALMVGVVYHRRTAGSAKFSNFGNRGFAYENAAFEAAAAASGDGNAEAPIVGSDEPATAVIPRPTMPSKPPMPGKPPMPSKPPPPTRGLPPTRAPPGKSTAAVELPAPAPTSPPGKGPARERKPSSDTSVSAFDAAWGAAPEFKLGIDGKVSTKSVHRANPLGTTTATPSVTRATAPKPKPRPRPRPRKGNDSSRPPSIILDGPPGNESVSI